MRHRRKICFSEQKLSDNCEPITAVATAKITPSSSSPPADTNKTDSKNISVFQDSTNRDSQSLDQPVGITDDFSIEKDASTQSNHDSSDTFEQNESKSTIRAITDSKSIADMSQPISILELADYTTMNEAHEVSPVFVRTGDDLNFDLSFFKNDNSNCVTGVIEEYVLNTLEDSLSIKPSSCKDATEISECSVSFSNFVGATGSNIDTFDIVTEKKENVSENNGHDFFIRRSPRTSAIKDQSLKVAISTPDVASSKIEDSAVHSFSMNSQIPSPFSKPINTKLFENTNPYFDILSNETNASTSAVNNVSRYVARIFGIDEYHPDTTTASFTETLKSAFARPGEIFWGDKEEEEEEEEERSHEEGEASGWSGWMNSLATLKERIENTF
ncbi:uncharacterized protein V2V93DRAFT_374024 [Kockiozyma suomiensis]|uniref:uncharacterized protein n=1 Tax=Kockiozyma suomiensis TaxID=1337062 RepID=UPI0033435DD1